MIICGRAESMSSDNYVHGDKEDRLMPQKTSFSNVSKISTGYWSFIISKLTKEKYLHVVLINGDNVDWVILILLKSHQVSFPMPLQTLFNLLVVITKVYFLIAEGIVYSVGYNEYGELGLGHNTNQNELNKIPNIPPIKIISCVRSSSYLIDFEGNLWNFGCNEEGQLDHGDKTNINTPKIISTQKDIQQISYGACADHFCAKNSQNQIFVSGNNYFGQLGTGDTKSSSILKEINSQYSTIWGESRTVNRRAKSARK